MKESNLWNVQSKAIDALRFPLIIMVVFIHTPGSPDLWSTNINWAEMDAMQWYNVLRLLFSIIIPNIAVPSFFLISGYLFFITFKSWDTSLYKSKVKRRIYTLLIPYFLWCLIISVFAKFLLLKGDITSTCAYVKLNV